MVEMNIEDTCIILVNCVSSKYDTIVAFALNEEILDDNEGKYCE